MALGQAVDIRAREGCTTGPAPLPNSPPSRGTKAEHEVGSVKIYLAARYSRLDELNGYRKELEAAGHMVTSRWLNLPGREYETLTPKARRDTASQDYADIRWSDVVIVFTEPAEAEKSHGGKHVEFGYAIGLQKVVLVVGPVENVFYELIHSRYGSWQKGVLNKLAQIQGGVT